jgi:hypothetical protein
MTIRPDSGPEYGEEKWQSKEVPPIEDEDLGEREIEELEREDEELEYLDPEDNEAHAPGQVCARCGQVITASQDVRRLPDGHWIHEVCPPDPGKPAPGGGGDHPR